MPNGTSPENILVDLNTRIRVLEEKNNLLRERMLVINQNMIEEYKKLSDEIKAINSDLKEIKSDLMNVKEMIKHFIKELESFARKDSIKVLEKYINMWNPLKFVTEKEVISLIEEHSKRGDKSSKRTRTSN